MSYNPLFPLTLPMNSRPNQILVLSQDNEHKWRSNKHWNKETNELVELRADLFDKWCWDGDDGSLLEEIEDIDHELGLRQEMNTIPPK